MEYKLIEAVQMFPCLFDKSKQAYRNKLLKEKAWSSVAAATGATVEQCQNRWRSLRDRYVRQLAAKPKSGAAAPEFGEWRYFNSMSFLQRHVAPRKTLSNIQWSASEEHIDTSEEFGFSCSSSSMNCNNSPIIFPIETTLAEPTDVSFEVRDENNTSMEEQTPKKSARKNKLAEEAHQRFDVICGAVTDLIALKKEPKSRNAEFLRVLDAYLLKHSEGEQDKLKMQILNLVYPSN